MKMKKIGILITAIYIGATLCGCGSMAAKNDTAMPAAAPMAAAYDYASDKEYYSEQSYMEPEEEGMVLYSKTESDSGTAEAGELAETQDKIIYSCSSEIETVEFDQSIEQTYVLIKRFGGFVQDSYITGKYYYTQYYNYNSYRTASFTVRVPRTAFSDFRGSLEEIGNVVYSSVYAENVSTQYHDTESRLKSCRTQESRLLELIEEAKDVQEILEIESRLSEVRYQIESLTTKITDWDSRINYSTVSITINEVNKLTEEKPTKPSFGEELRDGLKDSVEWLAEAVRNFTVFMVSALPLLVLPAVISITVVLLVRSKHNKKKKGMPSETENDVKDDD